MCSAPRLGALVYGAEYSKPCAEYKGNARPDVGSTSYAAWWCGIYASLPKFFDDIDCAGDGIASTKLDI